MKKIFLTIALTLGLTMGAMAQTDAFFSDYESFSNREGGDNPDLPMLPEGHGEIGNQNTPLGSGLLILTALGAGYAALKRKEER